MKVREAERMYAGNYVDGKCLLPFFSLYRSAGMSLIKTGRQIANKRLGIKKHINEKEN